MTEPDAEAWRRLFAALTGDAAADANTVRGFCETHRLSPAQVMAEMHRRRHSERQPVQSRTPGA